MLHFRGSDYRISYCSTWYDRMDSLLMNLVFTESKAHSNLCFKIECGKPVMLLLYVHDLFLTRKYELIKVARRRFVAEFKMKYLGMMHYFLGMEVWKNEDGISLEQGKYAVEILQRFGVMHYFLGMEV